MREDRRFVVGKGNFAADIVPQGVKHVALVTCPHPAARIVSIDKSAALAMPGVHYVLDGAELAGATNVLAAGLDTPNVPRYPLALEVARYAGEWVAAVVADSRALAEDAAEAVAVEYEPLPFVLDADEAYAGGTLVHEAHGSNVLLDRTFVWGEVEKDFAASPHTLKHRVKWGRSSTVPIETFGVTASWDPWREILDIWASIQMPKYPDQTAMALKIPMSSVRVHYDVDVGGSYGVKRGIKHTVLVGYLSKRLGVPVRLIEDRLENMRGGDMHGPERNFDIEVAFDDQGIIRSMKMRALDNVGAYAGRSPFQLGKPVGAIVGPYKIKSVQYQAIAVVTNKTVQEAVRAFGQSPTNYAIERTVDEVANRLGLDRLEVRRRNMIRHEEFPYLIPSGSTYDFGDYHTVIDKVLAHAGYDDLHRRARPAARRRACSPASASPHASSRPAAIRRSSRCSIPRSAPPPGWIPAASASIWSARSPRPCTRPRPGRATRPWSAPWSARCWRSIPTRCAWCARTRSIRCRATARSAAAWRSCSAAPPSTRRSSSRTSSSPSPRTISACRPSASPTRTAMPSTPPRRTRSEPGPSSSPWRTATSTSCRPAWSRACRSATSCRCRCGGGLPDADGRVQMYPCYSFEFHLMLVAIDPDLGKPEIKRYILGHDCGTVINPKIVRGMTMGGIAHGIGAALYEEFAYNDDGLLVAQNFMDYLLPSAHEVPPVEIVHHETPSPLTVFGQKGSGESGYLGAPAAVASAVNDAVRPLGIVVNSLPIKVARLGDMIAAAREKTKGA